MILRVKAELVDSETGEAALGFFREEVHLMDVSDGSPFEAAYVEAGGRLLDWLAEAQKAIGEQTSRTAAIVERARREEEK